MRLPRLPERQARSDEFVLRIASCVENKINTFFPGHCETAPMLELWAVVAITFNYTHNL